jgi:hypothetical protein
MATVDLQTSHSHAPPSATDSPGSPLTALPKVEIRYENLYYSVPWKRKEVRVAVYVAYANARLHTKGFRTFIRIAMYLHSMTLY